MGQLSALQRCASTKLAPPHTRSRGFAVPPSPRRGFRALGKRTQKPDSTEPGKLSPPGGAGTYNSGSFRRPISLPGPAFPRSLPRRPRRIHSAWYPLSGLHDGQVFFSPAGKLAQRCVQVARPPAFPKTGCSRPSHTAARPSLSGLRPCPLRKLYRISAWELPWPARPTHPPPFPKSPDLRSPRAVLLKEPPSK